MATKKNPLATEDFPVTDENPIVEEFVTTTENQPIVKEPITTTEEINAATIPPDSNDLSVDELLEAMEGSVISGEIPADSAESIPESGQETNFQDIEPIPEKPKRTRKKKEAIESESVDFLESPPPESKAGEPEESFEPPTEDPQIKKTVRKRTESTSILTIESRAEVETQENREDIIWHEIHNAYLTRRILSGILSGVEQTENGKSIAVVDYKDMRIIIPMKEMMINLQRNPSWQEYTDLMIRQNKILSNMLGAEIDFVIKGIESKTHTAVASRKDAMIKKRQLFYLTPDTDGMFRIYEGRIVQARVIAVAEKIVRVEVFGVECSVMARDMSWEWIGDAHEHYSVGDEVLVRVLEVQRNSSEDITIKVDAKSVIEDTSQENLKKCRVQSKYVGTVTDVRRGVVFIRLTNGVNAIAHACYDRRTPGKKDDVGFVITHIDEERGVAVGIITRIIKQNL